MLRIDRSVTPTMAKAPTLGQWELDLLRSIEDVVRLGHIRVASTAAASTSTEGSVAIADDALVVNCAADGLKIPPLRAVWQPDGDHPAAGPGRLPLLRRRDHRLRRGHPRRRRREEPRCARPSSYGNSCADWARMNVLGFRNAARSTPNPTSRTGPTGSPSIPPASHPSMPGRHSWTASWSGSRPMPTPGVGTTRRADGLTRRSIACWDYS